MKHTIQIITLLVATTFAQAALAQEAEDPNWPCEQRKVEQISIGQMWTGEISQGAVSEDAQKLAQILSLRRLTEEEAQTYVAEYVKTHPDTAKEDMGLVFQTVLNGINLQRAQIIEGIGRYAEGQQARAAEIDKLRQQMAEEEAKPEPDFDKIDKMETDIDWDERIYKDREHSLSYVCETPVLLEKQAYAVAQLLTPYAQ